MCGWYEPRRISALQHDKRIKKCVASVLVAVPGRSRPSSLFGCRGSGRPRAEGGVNQGRLYTRSHAMLKAIRITGFYPLPPPPLHAASGSSKLLSCFLSAPHTATQRTACNPPTPPHPTHSTPPTHPSLPLRPPSPCCLPINKHAPPSLEKHSPELLLHAFA